MKVKRRTGKLNFVTCMRQTLEKHYGDKPVGMGGAFIIQKGKVKTHIMVKASAHVCACVCVHVLKIVGDFNIH